MIQAKRQKRSRRLRYLSPKELAAAIGVSESSLKRWADEGLLAAERTVGGHRRIAVAEAIRFVRATGLSVVKPELLGLPPAEPGAAGAAGDVAAPGDAGGSAAEATERLYAALAADRAAEARSLIISLYVEGAGLGWLFDGPMRESLARIGELWEHSEGGVFLEHRATETCVNALAELRLLIPPPPSGAPVAVGGGAGGDVYMVPSLMAGLVLAEAGFEVRNLGPDTPVEAMLAAMRHYRPLLVWQSFSTAPRSAREAGAGLARIAGALAGGSLVVGGRGSGAVPLPIHDAVHRVDSMTELSAFARGAAMARGSASTGGP
jgi:MerR family transcriptional regulator, light-induced transcriptional regulator